MELDREEGYCGCRVGGRKRRQQMMVRNEKPNLPVPVVGADSIVRSNHRVHGRDIGRVTSVYLSCSDNRVLVGVRDRKIRG